MPLQRIQRNNNFDLLRLLFALMVFVTHLYELSQIDVLRRIPLSIRAVTFLTSGRAVQGFFIVSGFLIFMSYEHSATLKQYLEKRLRRLYPGYATNIVVTAVLLAFFSTMGWKAYFAHPQFWRFLGANLVFLSPWQWSLPGVFAGHHLTAVNGALWTLQVEVLFYLAVPFIAVFARRLGTMPVFGLLFLLSSAAAYVRVRAGANIEALLFPGQLRFFIAGGLLYYFHDIFLRHWPWLLSFAIGAELVDRFVYPMTYVHPLSLAVIVVSLACILPFLGHVSRHGDFSYSVYVYHFPVIQCLLLIFPDRPFALLLSSTLFIFLFAFLSWNFVEKRFLLRSSHYRQETDGTKNPHPSDPA